MVFQGRRAECTARPSLSGSGGRRAFRLVRLGIRRLLKQRLAEEKDPNVRQDLEILIQAAEQNVEGTRLSDKYQVPFFDINQAVFQGLRALLDDQVEPPFVEIRSTQPLLLATTTVSGSTICTRVSWPEVPVARPLHVAPPSTVFSAVPLSPTA